jgi:tRNA dimethylallyltransferase
MEAGFLDEVRELRATPGGLSRTARQALGYKELLGHLDDGVALHDALDLAKRRTRRFARRQQRWFRRDPRIEWFDLDATPESRCVQRCLELLARHG